MSTSMGKRLEDLARGNATPSADEKQKDQTQDDTKDRLRGISAVLEKHRLEMDRERAARKAFAGALDNVLAKVRLIDGRLHDLARGTEDLKNDVAALKHAAPVKRAKEDRDRIESMGCQVARLTKLGERIAKAEAGLAALRAAVDTVRATAHSANDLAGQALAAVQAKPTVAVGTSIERKGTTT